MKPYILIFNPNASKGKAKKKIKEIEKIFKENNKEIKILETKKANDALEFAKNATYERYDTIIAAGGDGTINEVINGIMIASELWEIEEKPKLGIIPIGRGNDFCFSANIPVNIKKAIDLILSGKKSLIDVGVAVSDNTKRKFFLNGLGIGVEPSVTFQASEYKHIHGGFSYLFALVHTLIGFPKPMNLKFIIDDKVEAYKTQQVSLGNGKRMGNMFIMCPHAKIDDKALDLVWANKEIKRRSFLYLALKFLKGTQLKTDKFYFTNVKQITIESDKNDMPIHCDGEELSKNCKNLYVSLQGHSIYLIKNN